MMRLLLSVAILCALAGKSLRVTAEPHVAHLVFEGGGVRGIAYAGALEVLEEAGVLANVESTSGTSVGGLVAVLYAVGYSPHELMAVLADLKIQRFNDGRWMFIGGASRMSRRYGWYRGEHFETWVASLIERKTSQRDLTFGDLHALRTEDPRFKEPAVFATDLTLQRTVKFSCETSPDMPLHLAARITMSVPLYFSAVFLDSAMQPVRKPARGGRYRVLVDGGIGANYPLGWYNDHGTADKQALGLKLERQEQIAVGPASSTGIAPHSISSLRDYMSALYNFAIEAANPDPPASDHASTIYISTEGIGPRVRRMKAADVAHLIESGRQGARRHLQQKSLTR